MPIPIICLSCTQVGSTLRVTAGMRCGCGSDDLDIYEAPSPGSLPFTAAMRMEADSGGTGWGKSMPDPLKGWGDYVGPPPGKNPFGSPAAPVRCTNCRGSGYDILDRGPCRACKGSGKHHPPTSETPEPQVARHPGQTSTPFMARRKRAGRTSTDPLGSPEQHIRETTPGYTNQGIQTPSGAFDENKPETFYPRMDQISPHLKTRQDRDYSQVPEKPLQLDQADCPECGHAPTHLIKDQKEDAWWHCENCGPLSNIDKNPSVNPFNHDTYSGREKGFKSASRTTATRKTGRVLHMFAAVSRSNPGMSQPEVLGLVRRTVQKYSE